MMPLATKQMRYLPAPSGLFGLVFMLVLVLTQGSKLLIDGDTYTHIYLGRWILENHALPTEDFLSHTVHGIPWVIHEWGAEALMGLAFNFAGLAGVAILFAALAGLTVMLIFRLLEELEVDPWLSLPLMTVTMLLLYPMVLARPHLFTWALGSLTFLLLYTRSRWLWTLPLLMVAWVNLHGGFILCVALQVLFIAGFTLESIGNLGVVRSLKAQRKELVILALTVLATGLNPHGHGILSFYFEVSALNVTQFNPEWQSPDLQAFWLLRAYLALLLFGLLIRRERLRWTHILLLALCLEATLTHRRHTSLIAILLLPVWVDLLAPVQERLTRLLSRFRQSGPANQTALPGTVCLVGATIGLFVLAHFTQSSFGKVHDVLFPISRTFPHRAWTFLEENPPAGKVYNEYSWGAYLIYQSEGTLPVFIDGFAHKYGEDVYRDYYRIARLEEQTEDLLEEYGVEWILFPTREPLVRYLVGSGDWQTAYQDDQASVLKRSAPLGK